MKALDKKYAIDIIGYVRTHNDIYSIQEGKYEKLT